MRNINELSVSNIAWYVQVDFEGNQMLFDAGYMRFVIGSRSLQGLDCLRWAQLNLGKVVTRNGLDLWRGRRVISILLTYILLHGGQLVSILSQDHKAVYSALLATTSFLQSSLKPKKTTN